MPDAIPFDMYQSGGFRHEGDRCTFEVLQQRFDIKDAAVRRIAEIVHDLDLKDDRFQSPDAPTIGKLVEGLRASIPDDAQLLAHGIALFEALYVSFQPEKPRGGARVESADEESRRCSMKFILGLLLLSVTLGAQAPSRRVIDFESDKVGQAPAAFSFGLTGSGRPGVWIVRKDEAVPDRGNVLAQTDADRTSYRFPVAVFNDITATDVDVSVRFRPVSGGVDQAAGLVWRFRDANNYYIVRANALEGNVVLYKVENGKRTDLPVKGSGRTYGKKADVPENAWSQMGVTVRGPLFTVSINGQGLYEVEDITFTGAGKVGLWTKADSVTYFDDLTIVSR